VTSGYVERDRQRLIDAGGDGRIREVGPSHEAEFREPRLDLLDAIAWPATS
jgi:hypothetical protein